MKMPALPDFPNVIGPNGSNHDSVNRSFCGGCDAQNDFIHRFPPIIVVFSSVTSAAFDQIRIISCLWEVGMGSIGGILQWPCY